MEYFKTISIRRTKAEWDIINQRISEANKEDLGQLLRLEISKFIKEYEDCPNCICKAKGRRTEKRPAIYSHQIEQLRKIAKQMDLRVSTLVDRLIIQQIINQD